MSRSLLTTQIRLSASESSEKDAYIQLLSALIFSGVVLKEITNDNSFKLRRKLLKFTVEGTEDALAKFRSSGIVRGQHDMRSAHRREVGVLPQG
jgi:hypothetical protein